VKIAAVVQRYGADIVGGAERLCRGVCEGLAGRGHQVEVLTSCAQSYRTWANAYREGIEQVHGVPVRRFRVERERDMAAFNAASEALFGGPASAEQQRDWVQAQGPYVPRLLDHLHAVAGECDRLLFFTYLYYPTVHGIHAAPERSVLVPTAHDEAPIYLEIYDAVLALPAGLIFNTEAEADFVRRRFPGAAGKRRVIGVGIDGLEALEKPPETSGKGPEPPQNAPSPTAEGRVPGSGHEAPASILYAGRIEPGKGVAELVAHLARFRDDTGIDVRLWLIGELAMELPDHPWIEVLGFVSEEEKIRRLQSATVLAAPSPLESFGIVALEAMAAGTPPLVNAAAAAAVEHCRKANAGLYYSGYDEFRFALELLLRDERLRAAMAKKGAAYVREHFSWRRVVDQYEAFLERIGTE
jgi:glycosyltransferase involved in cell wall biosynthesis